MTIEQKIKEIAERLEYLDKVREDYPSQDLHTLNEVVFLQLALEVIRELQVNNHNLNMENAIVKEGFETLKAHVDRARDLNGLCEIIAPIRTSEVSSYIAHAIQNYILGGEGAVITGLYI